MKATKLYCCSTQFNYDMDHSNSGELQFYTSLKALKNNAECWEQCGITEIDITGLGKVIAKPKINKAKFMRADVLEELEKIYIPLAGEVEALAEGVAGNLTTAKYALQWALGSIKRKIKNGKK